VTHPEELPAAVPSPASEAEKPEGPAPYWGDQVFVVMCVFCLLLIFAIQLYDLVAGLFRA
jgi:hypothetical protein